MTKRSIRPFVLILILLIAATAVGAFTVWPGGRQPQSNESVMGLKSQLIKAKTLRVSEEPCSPESPAEAKCQILTMHLLNGPEKGTETSVVMLPGGLGTPAVQAGETLVLERAEAFGNMPPAYSFADYHRTPPLFLLGLAFAIVVVAIGRGRGIGALAGLVITWLVISLFLLPSILQGHSPIVAAITAGSMICFAALYIAHGFNMRTTAALLGTLIGLIITGFLAIVAVDATHLTGQAAEDVIQVQRFAQQINVKGLLLGGIIIGSLGVLNDVTITQASAIWEIYRARPNLSFFSLYRSGMRIGRDHIASTVYTIVLAYVGAALPLLVLFAVAERNWLQVATSSIVSEEIVRTLAGSIGLVLTVPITTALAAIAVKRSGEFSSPDPASTQPSDTPNGSDSNSNEIGPGSSSPSDQSASRSTPSPIDEKPLSESSSAESERPTFDTQDADTPNTRSESPTPLHAPQHAPSHARPSLSDRLTGSSTTGNDATNTHDFSANDLATHEEENTGTIQLQAFYHFEKAKRSRWSRLSLRKSSPETYQQRMSWGERRFWGDFGK